VVAALIVAVHVVVVALVQPVHELNLFPEALLGAVRVTDVPALYVRVKPVESFPALLLSFGDTAMATALFGFEEFTVRMYVVTGGGVELLFVPPPPPHPATAAHANTARVPTSLVPKSFTTSSSERTLPVHNFADGELLVYESLQFYAGGIQAWDRNHSQLEIFQGTRKHRRAFVRRPEP
jgi:hypothetical protein